MIRRRISAEWQGCQCKNPGLQCLVALAISAFQSRQPTASAQDSDLSGMVGQTSGKSMKTRASTAY